MVTFKFSLEKTGVTDTSLQNLVRILPLIGLKHLSLASNILSTNLLTNLTTILSFNGDQIALQSLNL